MESYFTQILKWYHANFNTSVPDEPTLDWEWISNNVPLYEAKNWDLTAIFQNAPPELIDEIIDAESTYTKKWDLTAIFRSHSG